MFSFILCAPSVEKNHSQKNLWFYKGKTFHFFPSNITAINSEYPFLIWRSAYDTQHLVRKIWFQLQVFSENAANNLESIQAKHVNNSDFKLQENIFCKCTELHYLRKDCNSV